MVTPSAERFTQQNLQYTQAYLNYISRQNPYKLKFFDESGFYLPDTLKRQYGHAPKGKPAVEVSAKTRSPHLTLNLMIGLNGVAYAAPTIAIKKSLGRCMSSLKIFKCSVLEWINSIKSCHYTRTRLTMYWIRPFLWLSGIIKVSLRFSQCYFMQCIGYDTNCIGAVTKSNQMGTNPFRIETNKLCNVTLTESLKKRR